MRDRPESRGEAEDTRRERRARVAAVVAYLALSLPIAFLWLGSRDVHVMEGIVADGARHMARTGELAVPHLHGEVYNYKPPGAYWMALASVSLFGESEWALRLPFAASGVVMGLVVLLVAAGVLGARGGFWSGVAAVSGALVVQKFQLAEWDVALAAGVGVAITVAARTFATGTPSLPLWLLGYLGLACGFLVKGLPAIVLYVPGLVIAALVTRQWRQLVGPAHVAAVLLFVVVAGSWVGAAVAAEGWEVFAQPLLEAGEKSLGWTPSAIGRALAKPAVAVGLFLPWTLLLWVIVRRGWWRGLAPPERRFAQSAAAFAASGVFLLAAAAAPETRYLLPLCVPVGLLCGTIVAGREGSDWPRLGAGLVWALALVTGATAIGAGAVGSAGGAAGVAARVVAVAVGTAALALVVPGFRWVSHREVARLLLAIAVCHWVVNAVAVAPRRAAKRSLRPVAEAFEPHLAPGETIWTTPVAPTFHHSSLFYYLGRPVRTVTDTTRPEPGDHLVVFSDEPEDRPGYEVPVDYSVVATAESRRYGFTLGRVGSAGE